MKTAIFVYEVPQVEVLPKLLEKLGDSTVDVIACGADIEFLLEDKKIPYRSARALRTSSTPERLTLAKKLGVSLLEGDDMSFFTYRNIHLGRLFRPAIQYFLGNFLYAIDIVASALEEPYQKVFVYSTVAPVASAGAILGTFNAEIFPDAVALICKQRSISYEEVRTIPLTKTGIRKRLNKILFKCKRAIFGTCMHVLNVYVRLQTPKKKIRILASELWKNIEPLMEALPESELFLLDRTESLHIGMRAILRNRMQFVHGDDFVTSKMRRRAYTTTCAFKEHWARVQTTHVDLVHAAFKEYSLTPILTTVLDHFMCSAEKVVKDIDGAWSMLEVYKPDLVLVRAGISAQTHFAMLCEIARLQHIPSLEVQHGILSVFSGDFTSDPSPEYIAEYGPIVREELSKHNFAPRSTFVDIGSPRFDVYMKEQKMRTPMQDGVFNILHIGPPFLAGDWNDSYDVYDFFSSIASAARNIPRAHVTIKLRSGGVLEAFFREVIKRTFDEVPYSVETSVPLPELLPKADVVVSGHSTAFVEALLIGKPVIIDASLPIYGALADADLDRYKEAGVLAIARSAEELTETLARISKNPNESESYSKRVRSFMDKHYLLSDGKSSERLAAFIRELAEKQHSSQS